jgi:hypothetical protein
MHKLIGLQNEAAQETSPSFLWGHARRTETCSGGGGRLRGVGFLSLHSLQGSILIKKYHSEEWSRLEASFLSKPALNPLFSLHETHLGGHPRTPFNLSGHQGVTGGQEALTRVFARGKRAVRASHTHDALGPREQTRL